MPLLARLRCGTCLRGFDANPRRVPCLRGHPTCPTCWDTVNTLRERAGLPPWGCPGDAYPTDRKRGDHGRTRQ